MSLLELEEVSLGLVVLHENAGVSNLYQTYAFIGGFRNLFLRY
jgi:hypothetical protein